MAYQKLQAGLALEIIPSAIAIPNPAYGSTLTGTNDVLLASNLEDTTADFITAGVSVGDVVYNTTDGTTASVTVVVSATVLTLSADIFLATAKSYKVFAGASMSPQNGCVLYVGTGGDVVVETTSGSQVTFKNIANAQFMPVQVLKVLATTTASDIIALW